MTHTTITRAITDALDDLRDSDFEKFRFHLRDRREEPRVRRAAVEGRNVLDITDVLVSTFTELGARKVTLEILRQINCNQVANALESKSKVCVDKGDPTFRKTSNGELETEPTQEAKNHVASRWPLNPTPCGDVKKPEEVEAEAKACVRSEGGDPCNGRLVLSRCMMQFGQYKGKTFKWLLENDVMYAIRLVASHQKERDHRKDQNPLMANKDSLTRYVIAYPEVLKGLRFHHGYEEAKERSRKRGQQGVALVGFGIYKSETLQDLYESKEEAKISYVNFLRGKKSTCDPGSRMEDAVKYILKRDQQRDAAAAATRRPTTRFISQGARKTKTRQKSVRSTQQFKWRRTWGSRPSNMNRRSQY